LLHTLNVIGVILIEFTTNLVVEIGEWILSSGKKLDEIIWDLNH
jgi:hypothetical protein